MQGSIVDFLTRHVSFVPNPWSITLYSMDIAVKTGHYVYSTVTEQVFQIIIKDLSGRELWLDCYVDEKISTDRQSDIMSVLEALEFDIVQSKSNRRVISFINNIFREEILVQNYNT